MNLATVINAVLSVGTQVPEFVALINEVKAGFSETDQAAIDAIMRSADAVADAQHVRAQAS